MINLSFSVQGILVGNFVMMCYVLLSYVLLWMTLGSFRVIYLGQELWLQMCLCISVSSCALVTVSWNSEGAGQTTDKGMITELAATADQLVFCLLVIFLENTVV